MKPIARLARRIREIEEGRAAPPDGAEKSPGRVIAITGPPGIGKSTLIGRLIAHHSDLGRKVAALLIDPSSPRTGGAILGDRVRMQEVALKPGVFIRSFATRGSPDGIPAALPGAIAVLKREGYDPIFIETVGAGQLDVAVARVADFVVLVTGPHLGDEIQAMKAGLAEVCDCVCVNKADLPDAAQTVSHWKAQISVPVVAVCCQGPPGIGSLLEVLEAAGGR